LIGLLIFVPIPYGSVEPWSIAVFECWAFSLALLWCVHAIVSGGWFEGDLRLFLPLIAVVAFATIQSFTWSQTKLAGVNVFNALSADPFETWAFALRLSALTIAALLAVRFTDSTLRLNILVYTIIVVAMLSAGFGIVRIAIQHRDGFLLESLHWGGGFAQFINRNHFAFLAEPAIGLLSAMILFRRNIGHRKLIYVSALILLWAALIMSRSRGGLLAGAAQITTAALWFSYLKWTSTQRVGRVGQTRLAGVAVLVVIAIISLVVGTTIWLGGDQLSTGVDTAATELNSRTQDHESARRRDIWRATLRMARAHPFAGAGFGAYWAEIPKFHDGSGILTPQQAHNDYLEVLASGGVIGVGLLGWFVVALAQTSRRALRTFEGAQRVFAIGALIGIVGVGIHSLVDFGLHMTGNALVFVMLLAVLSLKRIDERSYTQAHPNAAFNSRG
jgi:O-antigen ligase